MQTRPKYLCQYAWGLNPWPNRYRKATNRLPTPYSRALAKRIPWELANAGIKENLAGYLGEHAHERRVWLLLDGFDALTDPTCPDPNWIFKGLQQWDCRVIIASRQYGHGAVQIPFPVSEYRLTGLSAPQQVADFLAHWFDKEEQRAKASAFLDKSASAKSSARFHCS